MTFEMLVQQFLQGIFNFFYPFFKLITELGDETAILVMVAVIYFGIDKKAGERIGFTVLFSGVLNGLIKIAVRRPRPFVKEPAFAKADLAEKYADSFSFPSGHAQNSAALYLSIKRSFKNKFVSCICITLITLICFSRIILGVHYISDVLAGLALGIAIVYLVNFLLNKAGDKEYKVYLFSALAVLGLSLLVLFPLSFFVKLDQDLFKTFGAFIGFGLGVYLEHKFVNLEIKVAWKWRLLRIFIVLGLLLALKTGLKALFGLFGDLVIWDLLRYIILTFTAIYVCPLCFVKFQQLRMNRTAKKAEIKK